MNEQGNVAPEYVPVVTLHKGKRVSGLLLVPGTKGFKAVLPFGLNPSKDPAAVTTLRIPVEVSELSSGRWVFKKDTGLHIGAGSQELSRNLGQPIDAKVPTRSMGDKTFRALKMGIPVSIGMPL